MLSEKIQSRPRTIMDVFHMLPEGTLAEVINGTLYMSPSPTPKHQRIVRKLGFALSDFVDRKELGEIFLSPCDVFMDDTANAVQPDIIFVSRTQATIVKEDQNIQGIPEMIIEVLSPGNSDHDLITKRKLYERFGVKEYWIIDPKLREATGFYLADSFYKEIGTFKGLIHSRSLHQQFQF